MGFEWDDEKEDANLGKHGIRFPDAVTVFNDPAVLIEDVTKPEYGEQRWKAVGRVGPTVIVVIFTVRGGTRRIISARRSRRNERRHDHQGPTAS